MEKPSESGMRLEPARSLVVYHAESGHIVQVHYFAAMPGADLPPKAQVHEMALRHAASKHGREIAAMKVLEVDSRVMKPKATYGVSTSERTLIEAPAPAEL